MAKELQREGRFPNWEKLYAEEEVETMPWYCPELDADLAEALLQHNITTGSFLDLGTGPGTQAVELAKRGFAVTGSDLSQSAIEKAKTFSSLPDFTTDNFLETQLPSGFDYVFDRGCFHLFAPKERGVYVKNLSRIMAPQGLYFLKCFSTRETNLTDGPYLYSPEALEEVFSSKFQILSTKQSEYKSTMDENPKALFAVMRQRN